MNVPVSDIGHRLRDVTVWHGASLSLSHWVAQIDLLSRYERNFEPTRSSLRSVIDHIGCSGNLEYFSGVREFSERDKCYVGFG